VSVPAPAVGRLLLHLCATECKNATRVLECQLHTIASMAKTSAISVRVSIQVKAAAEKAASDDSRSVASYVEKLLAEHLRANGYLADQPRPTPKRGQAK